MERPDFNFKKKERVILIPTEKFLTAEYEWGDISEELAELKDFHIEMHNEVLDELLLENPNSIPSICESPINHRTVPQTTPNTPKTPRKVVKFSDDSAIDSDSEEEEKQ